MSKKKPDEPVEPKFVVKKRVPKEKPNFFQNIPSLKHPLAEILKFPAEQTAANEELIANDGQDLTPPKTTQDYPTTPNTTQEELTRPKTTQPDPTPPKQKRKVETSPISNFTKVPNSITQEAIPQGLFKGLSKHTYDVLYKQTRGAIKPVRQIQMTKAELMQLTGLSENTVSAHINHLKSVGLVQATFTVGKHQGAVYEVFIPEELTPPKTTQDYPTPPNPAQGGSTHLKTSQQLGGDTPQQSGGVRGSNSVENITTYGAPKTLFKTLKQIDDEKPIVSAIEMFNEAARAATGSDLTQKEVDALPELFKIIIEETSLARIRTSSVTNYTRFAAENLRRRLAANPRTYAAKEKPFEPGSDGGDKNQAAELESFEPEPLSESARENALVIYRPVAKEQGIEALENVRGNLTAEDWEWLVENLRED